MAQPTVSQLTDEHVERTVVPEVSAPLGFETVSVHGGYDPSINRDSVDVPIYPSVAYDLRSVEHAGLLATGETSGFSYSRVANPTVDALEQRIARLEGGVGAVAVGSGMAAVSYALLCAAEGGGRIISPTDLYGASVDAMGTFFPQFGIHTDFVDDINDLAEVESKMRPDTRAIFAETVANPSTNITDLRPLADLAHRYGIVLIVDNTVPTPYLLRPIEFGADIVVHSTTKGISGHGNALGGIIVDAGHFDWANGRFPHLTRKELVISDKRNGMWRSFVEAFGNKAFIRRIRTKYVRTFGAVLSPFNAYLQLVGLETLSQRISQETATAKLIAKHLQAADHIVRVNYSGLDDDAQHELAARYLPQGVGSVLSFEPEGDMAHVRRIIKAVRIFSYVPNIGDSRSLIVNPARITHREVPENYRLAAGVNDKLLRLSIGLESPADLIVDLDQAIASAY